MCYITTLLPSSLFARGAGEGYKRIDCLLLLFRNGYCCGGRRVSSDLYRAVTSKLKGNTPPLGVSLQSPWITGFRVILSHLPQRPTAALLSHADVAGESVHRVLLVVWENEKLCSPCRAFEQRDATKHMNPWSRCRCLGGSMSTLPPSWHRPR